MCRYLTSSASSSNHVWTSPGAWIGALSSWKTPSPAENKVSNIGWTWSAKNVLYFSPVIFHFRIIIGPAENHDTAAHIMTNPLPRLIVVRRKKNHDHTLVQVSSKRTHHVQGKSVKDDLSEPSTLSSFY
ncbi:hypothetical protein TNCV_1423881 [Trichonephila clavipes]|nr:hypothetical protein TNCV_1423881 [Trichonephila clavipes]